MSFIWIQPNPKENASHQRHFTALLLMACIQIHKISDAGVHAVG
jgi:hypothetical protein